MCTHTYVCVHTHTYAVHTQCTHTHTSMMSTHNARTHATLMYTRDSFSVLRVACCVLRVMRDCMCIYINMYISEIYMYICNYLFMYIYIYIYMDVYMYMDVPIYVRV